MTTNQNSTTLTLTLNVQWSAALDALIVATAYDPTRYYCVSRDWRVDTETAYYTVWAIGNERIGELTVPESIPLNAFNAMQEYFGQEAISEPPQAVKIKFERGSLGLESPEYGPFNFAQLTYEALRVGPDGEFWTIDSDPLSVQYSDVVIFASAPVTDHQGALREARRTLETLLTCDHCGACEYCNGHKIIQQEIAAIDAALAVVEA